MNNPNQSYFDKYFDPVVRDIDRVNIYEFENGMDYELTQSGKEINLDSIKSAQAKVLKNLKKDPAYYTNLLAAESVKMFGEYGSGKGRVAKSTTAKEAEAQKKDGKSPKINKQDSPFGVKDELKGKYKSSGMEPTKKSLKESYSSVNDLPTPAMLINMDKAKLKAAIDNMDEKDKNAFKMKLKNTAAQIKDQLKKKIKDLKIDFDLDETMDYKISNQSTSTEPGNYSQGTMKYFDENVNVADSRKIRLTPTTKNQIMTLVHETIEEALFQNKLNPSQVISVKPGEVITKDSEFSSKFTKLP